MANPWVPLDRMCSVNDRIPSIYEKIGWCPSCNTQNFVLSKYETYYGYDNFRYGGVKYTADGSCHLCGTTVKFDGDGQMKWPNKPEADASLLNSLNQISLELMAEAVGSFKDEKDAMAVRLRKLAKQMKKELEKYGV